MIDLFNYKNIDAQELKDSLAYHIGEWVNYFSLDVLAEIKEIINVLEEDSDTHPPEYYPDISDIFRIYRELRPDQISVVILSKEPYSNLNANGIAFGCEISISESLKQIYNAIRLDLNCDETLFTKSLEYLVKQNVMLLNCLLITTTNDDYKKIKFDNIINETLDIIQRNNTNVVYMLWGNEARDKAKKINPKTNLVLESEHPISHSYAKTQWRTNHFSECNKYKKDNNLKPITWI